MAKLIAHRGLSSKALENTKQAFELAGQNPRVFGIETDIWLTKDDQLVCCHNSNPFNKPHDDKIVTQCTYQEMSEWTINNVDVKYKIDQLSHICTFDEYLDVCKKYNKYAIVEIKQQGLDETIIQTIIDRVIKKGLGEQCYFISFDSYALELTHKLAPSIPTMYLIETKRFGQKGIGREGIIEAIKNKHSVSCRHWLMTKKIVALAKANQILTSVWTVNHKWLAKHYAKMGVDFITSNKELSI